MNEEELIKFLKENLKIKLEHTVNYSNGSGHEIHAKLFFGKDQYDTKNWELITEASEYLPID